MLLSQPISTLAPGTRGGALTVLIHIAAKLLGHASITTTTQGYHAVFQDELIRSY